VFRRAGKADAIVLLGILGAFRPADASPAGAQERQAGTPAAVAVDGQIALHALMSLGDTHLRNVANTLRMVASTDAARSAVSVPGRRAGLIRPPLCRVPTPLILPSIVR
jgi:hypothetical protein